MQTNVSTTALATAVALAASSAFDFATVEVKHTGIMVVKNPKTGDPTPASIELAGPEHPTHKQIDLNTARALRKKINRAGKLELDDPEDDIERDLEKAVRCTLSWTGVVKNGVPLECTPANVRELYLSAPWLLAQVKEYLGKQENFIESAEAS